MRASTDRISALGRMPAPDLAALLSRVPDLASQLGLTDVSGGATSDVGLTDLGILLASPRGILSVIRSLNRLERQLLIMAALHDGAVSREQVIAEAPDTPELDHAASALALLTLAYPADSEGAWLVLRPGVTRHVPLPGIRIYSALANLASADLDMLLQRLGAIDIPYRHEDRRRLVGRLLRQPDVARDLHESLEPEAARIIDLLVEHGDQRIADLGLPPFDPWDRRGGPLHQLVQSGMAGVDLNKQRAFSWLDLRIGLRGSLFDDWPTGPPAVRPEPLQDTGAATPSVLRRLHQLLELWGKEPAAALASGGIGVRVMRGTAKAFGMDVGAVGMLVSLAIDLGLLGQTEEADAWGPTAAAATLDQETTGTQWAQLVAAWQHATTIDERAGLPTRWNGDAVWPAQDANRAAVLRVLTSLDPGVGVPPEVLGELCAWHYPESLGVEGATAMVQALRLLGLVPAAGPVGLTTLGRTLLTSGPTQVDRQLGIAAEHVIVQADHSVVAPPNLAPGIARQLASVAVLESEAGAQIWRITSERIAEAMAAGRSRDELVTFLTETSQVPVPPNVVVTIDDAAARHGRLRAGVVGSYLRCEDPVDMTGAAAVSGAKLRVLSPTVAVSPLSREKLIGALRARGLLAVAEDGDGLTIPPRRVVTEPLEWVDQPDLDLVHTPDGLAIAERLLASSSSTAASSTARPISPPDAR
ncbi:helicase-associated domain-containing protein [Euzebya tangerina]|uniref:helicase-associated domain-containing protein n=1 Tax=Euzebya tangerina TaxID=591198 RepID=UPI000E30B5FD|nr:helicase-associated domain-containing protein [Euzebya tangerina]